MSVFHHLLFAGVHRLAMDVDGGGEFDDRRGWSGLVVTVAKREHLGAANVDSVPVRDRMCCLRVRLHRNLVEQAGTLRPFDAELPPLAADGAGAAHGFVECPLLIDEARILGDHGRDDLLARLLAENLDLRQPVVLDELQVVALLLLQYPER